jgi:hypothetical protein
MPQARLPDINSAFQRLINKSLSSLESENYTACIGSLNGLNALLAKDYRVEINDAKYYEKITPHVYVFCTGCQKKFERNEIKMETVIVPTIDRLISEQKTEKFWICTDCQFENRQLLTRMQKTENKQPQYLHVIPNPPKRRDGLMSRSTYHNNFKSWFWMFFDELQERMAQFRDDNWKRQGDIYDDDYVDTEGEDES